jgi:hypothetical protein
MNMETALLIASRNFVVPERRDRFIHEARKKPAKLMVRVCHEIETLFENRFRNGKCTFKESNECLLFTLTGQITTTTWLEAMKTVGQGGGGILIIDETGERFFAQSEGYPPPIQFSGDADETPKKSLRSSPSSNK